MLLSPRTTCTRGRLLSIPTSPSHLRPDSYATEIAYASSAATVAVFTAGPRPAASGYAAIYFNPPSDRGPLPLAAAARAFITRSTPTTL